MQQIQALLTQYLREEAREEIYNNYQASIEENKTGKLNFFQIIFFSLLIFGAFT